MLRTFTRLCLTLVMANSQTPERGYKINATLVPVFLTPQGYDHSDHEVTGVELGGGKFNLRCVEHGVNIGIFVEQDH